MRIRRWDKLAALAAADLYVLPSYSENFGVSPVEAMAAGVPVVLSDQVAVSTEVAQSDSGLIVPCKEVDLSKALQMLAGDPKLRQEMGSNGRRTARQSFSSATMAQRVLALYENILAQSGRRRPMSGARWRTAPWLC